MIARKTSNLLPIEILTLNELNQFVETNYPTMSAFVWKAITRSDTVTL